MTEYERLSLKLLMTISQGIGIHLMNSAPNSSGATPLEQLESVQKWQNASFNVWIEAMNAIKASQNGSLLQPHSETEG